ncbi:MAG: NifB/NifX family molybdenum-iron cluster-binding protein [Desulfobacterales bacterium]
MKKILIPIFGNDISPRFDLTAEVYIINVDENSRYQDERIIVLPQISAEHLCHLILTENVHVVICGGIEDEYYQYLAWKRITVYDSVIGPWHTAVSRYLDNSLRSGDILEGLKEDSVHE